MARAEDPPGREGGPSPGDDPLTRALNAAVTRRPWTVVLLFVLATAVLVGGIGGGGGQEAGADQFQEDIEEYDALQEMNDNFAGTGRSSGGTGITIFLSDERNVLSKPALLDMLALEERFRDRYGERIESTSSPASGLALAISEGEARTVEAQRRVLERVTDRQLREAIRLADERGDLGSLSDDFRPQEGTASVAQLSVSFDTPAGAERDQETAYHYEAREVIDQVDGFTHGETAFVLSGEIVTDEINQLLTDTAVLVFPAAVLLIVFFLLVAYRDPFDLVLGLLALLMTMVWTFGFMGYAGIPFSDSLIPVFPLLLAVGIDFGIHIINRYREERAAGRPVRESMWLTTGQLGTAFLIVTVTTVFGFAANLSSPLGTLQDFGIVASVGMGFTFLIFGVFLPAGKVGLDELREGTAIPSFGTTPLGQRGSLLGDLLSVGVTLARVAPVAVLVIALVLGAAGGAAGTDIDTEFSMESFFPNEDRVESYQTLPEPVRPMEYTFIPIVTHLEEDYGSGWIGTVTVFVDDTGVRSAAGLADVDRALSDPPDAFFRTDDRRGEASSVLDPITALADENASFAALLERSDTDGDGLPNRNVDRVYDRLMDSAYAGETSTYLSADRTATRIVYDLPAETDSAQATEAATAVAGDMRLDATATGQIVVDQVVIDLITDSALSSLLVAFVLTAVFLMVSFRLLEGRAVYGVLNVLPVLVVVGLLAGSMRVFDIPFTPFNAPILAVSIGLGVDYSVHFMHRFVDEFEANGEALSEALLVTIQGTGGALTGSMLTTLCGLGVLYLAVIPLIMEFGLLLALGVLYAYLAAVLVLPSTIVVWFGLERRLAALGDG